MANSLLLNGFPHFLEGQTLVVEASHLQAVRVGQNLRLASSELGRLRGEVMAVERRRLLCTVKEQSALPDRAALQLVVGLVRPQSWKKIIEVTTATGVQSVHVVRCHNSEKSFLESEAYEASYIAALQRKCLEQAWDAVAPVVNIHPRFRPFAEDTLAVEARGMPCVLFDVPTQRSSIPEIKDLEWSKCAWACIGPEAGWSDFERECLLALPTMQVGWLGDRILRCEQAVQAVCFAKSFIERR